MYSCRQAQQIAMSGQDRVVANVVGDAYHPGGFGAHARGFAAALGRQVPIAFGLPAGLDSPVPPGVLEVGRRPFSQHAPTIWIGPVMPVPDLPGTKRIGWITWETTKVPEPYVLALRQFDSLWVPSKFCRDLLASSLGTDVPVDVVQEGVDEQLFHPPAMLRSVSEGPFRFLAIGKWERRKGHEYVVQAFLRAFSKKDNVELGLRLTPSNKDSDAASEELKMLLRACPARRRPAVRLLPPFDPSELAQRYRDSHAFVLATRSEAWGLPILEAMASGLPCIVTEYGGHLDYCTHQNAYLIPPKGLVRVSDPVYFPSRHNWGVWAEPDVERIAEAMHAVWANYGEARLRGERAHHDATRQWSWTRSAQVAWKTLGRMTPARGATDSQMPATNQFGS